MAIPLPLVFDAPRRGLPPRHFADLDAEGRTAAMGDLGVPAFRGKQLAHQYFSRLEGDPVAMTDLPAALREQVGAALFPSLASSVRDITADDGNTRKSLWKLHDGTLVESVLMRYPDRATLCISSQAGCGMACPFCATGQAGLERNLSAAEILEQVRVAARALRDGEVPGGPGRLSNVVFMGMGEPLANYKRVLTAVRGIVSPPPYGFGLSQRSVTVSTVGVVPAIHKLAEEGLQVTLAVSLHTPDDELRDTLVPVNNRWPISEVLDAARHYADATGRRVSIEYALIRDVNDQTWRGEMLGRLLAKRLGHMAHVNLIPLNPTPGSEWDASPKPQQDAFQAAVQRSGVSCTVRDTRGQEISAACGQLAAEG
ncbi:23S rRNA (adenine(2503)-C(2))-methyltransferase RlmN [Rhodococcus sp. IEGM 1408]|uniref:23S rRNA (adenine(2503)-C(2))-methyltransferase RlmN n=1 Tax=Rhodococcus sp. IEGM 1408 TaxID=3082220 RepID=UPI0029555E2C|nr:23S rRNA (adenine(2503)-C(2))-methyltransferase RlmN [Rhodococcus sp. IEGM 1408]MDV8000444.1 23S rRNA (adenine(2503)-C(2))-methyltransferase RlmN [Rhodococcus sp. IEGM 1408]